MISRISAGSFLCVSHGMAVVSDPKDEHLLGMISVLTAERRSGIIRREAFLADR